jgi:hypothetical protein
MDFQTIENLCRLNNIIAFCGRTAKNSVEVPLKRHARLMTRAADSTDRINAKSR